MNPRSASQRERWVYALKVASWPKLLVAALLGQAVGIAATGGIRWVPVLFGLAFTVLHLCFVVLLNDWGDQEVDALKRRLFPEESSPKTIVDEILDARSVLYAGLGAGAAAAGSALLGELWLGRPGLAGAALGCMALFWAYTLPPLRLNYRGGGEILEMVGVGVALPWWNAYLQSGDPTPATLAVLPAFALLALSSALASGLCDEHSDRLGGKTTFTVVFGAEAVHRAVEGLVLGGMVVWGLLPVLAPGSAALWQVLPVVMVMAIEFRELRVAGDREEMQSYRGMTAFKMHLHRCIWRGTTALALTLVAAGLLATRWVEVA